jgi:hypothetical protein
MSEKVLKLANRRPMLLTLIIMATITIGLLFSGWLTPAPTKAQNGGGNPSSGGENTNCVTSSVSTNCCAEATVTLSNVPPIIICIGSSASASTLAMPTNGVQIVDTGYTNASNSNCPDTYQTNYPAPSLLTNWWTASGCGINTNGSGLSTPSWTPTNGGQITVTFNQKWKHTCDTNTETATSTVNINVVAVDSIGVVGSFSAEAYNDPSGDTNTTVYVVPCSCNSNIIMVSAEACPLLADADLPSCWQMTGGLPHTFQDGKVARSIRGVDACTVGTTTITATCGTSTKTAKVIVYKAIYKLSANEGARGLANVGHAWMELSIQPTDIYSLLTAADPDGTIVDYSQYLGVWGYEPAGSNDIACPGRLDHNDGSNPTTATYSFPISARGCLRGLIDVRNVKNNPGWYVFWGNACCGMAEEFGEAASAGNGCDEQTPWTLSDCLKDLTPLACLCLGL